jgi:hypothetical protein
MSFSNTMFAPLFADDMRQEWLERIILTEADAFIPLPTSSHIPLPPPGDEGQWVLDKEELSIFHAKSGGGKGYGSLPYQKIVADLGTLLDLPIPPGIIWEADDKFYFVTPLAFAISSAHPPDRVLKADPNFPAMTVFDWTIRNRDRVKANVTWNNAPSITQSRVVYIDHEHALEPKTSKAALLHEFKDAAAEYFKKNWFLDLKTRENLLAFTLQSIPESPRAQLLIDDLENLSSQKIEEIVRRIPSEFFPRTHSEQKNIITAFNRRRMMARQVFIPTATP